MLLRYKYSLFCNLREKSQIFWSLLFPLLLGTLFAITFGDMQERLENFFTIPVAVVSLSEDHYFEEVIDELATAEEPLLLSRTLSLEDAYDSLERSEVGGIYVLEDHKVQLIVAEQGMNQSILKSISDSYTRTSEAISDIATVKPDMINDALTNLEQYTVTNNEITLANGVTDSNLQYFFSLLALTCLYGCFLGLYNVVQIQADQSSLAVRRCVSPTPKLSMILCDFLATTTIQFVQVLIVIVYLAFIHNINFGSQWGYICLTSLVGSFAGISLGTLAGTIGRSGHTLKHGLLIGITLLLCFMSGLMYGNIKDMIEQNLPILNRLNPAVMLSDAYYCLTVYDNYSRYLQNIGSLLLFSVLCCILASLMLRRKKYASI